jgi:hypothetical protein
MDVSGTPDSLADMMGGQFAPRATLIGAGVSRTVATTRSSISGRNPAFFPLHFNQHAGKMGIQSRDNSQLVERVLKSSSQGIAK